MVIPSNCMVCSISIVSSPNTTEVINESEHRVNPEWKGLSFLTVAL